METNIVDGKFIVKTQYNPRWNNPAKNLGGKWNSSDKAWEFDARDEDRVRGLLQQIYGEGKDAIADLDTVTVQATFEKYDSKDCKGFYTCGRLVAYACSRDSGARLGAKVILLKGNFNSGGSWKNWITTVASNTVVEIKDVPRNALELLGDADVIEIIDSSKDNLDILIAEKNKLLNRISEIDSILSSNTLISQIDPPPNLSPFT